MPKIKIGFISTLDSDNYIFEKVYIDIKNQGIEFKILDSKCTEKEFNHFLEFIKDATVVFTRLMGGKDAFKFFDNLKKFLSKNNIPFIPLPTSSEIHPDLIEASTVKNEVRLKVFKYLGYEGFSNYKNLLLYLGQEFGDLNIPYNEPESTPWQGIYYKNTHFKTLDEYLTNLTKLGFDLKKKPIIGILFYRSWFIADNIEYVDGLIQAIESKGAIPIAVFTTHIKNELGAIGTIETFNQYFKIDKDTTIHALINTISFTLTMGVKPNLLEGEPEFLKELNIPILQGLVLTGQIAKYEESLAGINPIDIAIGMALPEFDGAIIHFPIAGKKKIKDGIIGVSIVKYKLIRDRGGKIVDLAIKYTNLKLKKNKDKKIAIVFHNYPPRADKIATAFGLDSPQSVINLLKEMKNRGFITDDAIYQDGTHLIKELLKYPSYDKRYLTENSINKAKGKIDKKLYEKWFNTLSEKVKNELIKDWGEIPGEVMNFDGKLIVPGMINGNVFITIQPVRGFSEDPSAIYHSSDISPPHHYIAFYKWIKDVFKADAIMHIGKHGTLEWLPGKCAGLSKDCYPDCMMDLPNIYPYIVNNPGEGTQAKRRSYATIVSHLIPAMTMSEIYGVLSTLEKDIDEYNDADSFNKKELIKKEILIKIAELNIDEDLIDGNIISSDDMSNNFEFVLNKIHNYIEELKNRQINDGLHTMGVSISGDRLINMIFMIVRYQFRFLEVLSNAMGHDYEALCENQGKNHKAIDNIHETGLNLIREFMEFDFNVQRIDSLKLMPFDIDLKEILIKISEIYNNLMLVDEEIFNSISALEGNYIPPRIAGAPTKDVNCIPTGRNFFSCNPQEIPTKSAYETGVKLGKDLIDKYLNEEGKYPEYLGVIIWGSPTMRTKGDDVGEILYLLGTKPKWNSMGRVVGVEVIPIEELNRPRIDVTLRISGLFRDTFPQVVDVIDDAIRMVASLDESDEMNFVKKHYIKEVEEKIKNGIEKEVAEDTSLFRIFSAKPGIYGAGVGKLLDEKNWESHEDMAKVFVEWGGYAYGRGKYGVDAKNEFVNRLSKLNLTVKNEDSQEWDIFEGDDFNSFHGGMIATVKHISGKQPKSFVGDTSNPEKIKTKHLKEEGKQVFRTKILNPKWIEGMKRHGYKGAGDFSKYVDHMFGWDATSNIIDDWMYDEIAEKYVFDKDMNEFFKENNSYALMNITERLIEAMDRGMWKPSDKGMEDRLKVKYLEIEGVIEKGL